MKRSNFIEVQEYILNINEIIYIRKAANSLIELIIALSHGYYIYLEYKNEEERSIALSLIGDLLVAKKMGEVLENEEL